MKYLVILSLLISVTPNVFADGFVCHSKNGALDVRAYNNTDAKLGTRTGAVMVLSDPQAKDGEKTIARFSREKGTLTGGGTSYIANVDLRFKDQRNNKEALVAGKAHLLELDTIELHVDFDYAGVVRLNTRAGDHIDVDVSCERYLKN